MPDTKQLPFLIKLLDDDAPPVRDSVMSELRLFGPDLELELARLSIVPTLYEREVLHDLFEEHRRTWLRRVWPEWFEIDNDKQKLEMALGFIAGFMHGRSYHISLNDLLDRLVLDFEGSEYQKDARTLARFLFGTLALKGAPQEEYYNPLNSSLIYVVEEKKGIPISLACVYILVGHRLGFEVEGINLPGHFLARCTSGGRSHVVDCFNGGHFLNHKDLASIQTPEPITMQAILNLECDASIIIARVLRNLVNAYGQSGREVNANLVSELLMMMDGSALSPTS